MIENEWTKWKREKEAELEKLRPKTEEDIKPSKKPKPRRKITQDELDKLARLQKVSILPGTPDKRFIQAFANATDEFQITDSQGNYIQILWYKYRKQLGHSDPAPEGYIKKAAK